MGWVHGKLYFPSVHTSLLHFWLLRIKMCLPGNWSLRTAAPLSLLHRRLHFNHPTEKEMKGKSGGSCPMGGLCRGAVCCYTCIPTGDSMGGAEEWRRAEKGEGVYPFMHAHRQSSSSSHVQTHTNIVNRFIQDHYFPLHVHVCRWVTGLNDLAATLNSIINCS